MGQNGGEGNQADTGGVVEGVRAGQQRATIYAQVSTADQSCERQLRDLAAFAERGGYEVDGAFAETASGTKDSRRERRRVMELAQARKLDAVLVTELFRRGRSTRDLLDTLHRLAG